jgi:hypothetical protein
MTWRQDKFCYSHSYVSPFRCPCEGISFVLSIRFSVLHSCTFSQLHSYVRQRICVLEIHNPSHFLSFPIIGCRANVSVGFSKLTIGFVSTGSYGAHSRSSYCCSFKATLTVQTLIAMPKQAYPQMDADVGYVSSTSLNAQWPTFTCYELASSFILVKSRANAIMWTLLLWTRSETSQRRMKQGERCRIWGFHGGDYDECRLLGYKTPVRTSQETHYLSATESIQLMLCKIWGFCCGDYDECDIKPQFVLHRRHITSPLQSPSS